MCIDLSIARLLLRVDSWNNPVSIGSYTFGPEDGWGLVDTWDGATGATCLLFNGCLLA
jgi:hypothetical protein